MTVKLLTRRHLEFLSLKGGCTGSSVSILVKMPHCWKSHVTAHYYGFFFFTGAISLCASNVSNTDIVYKATVTDAEGDSITIGMPSCLPASCPFGFTNGNVQRVD